MLPIETILALFPRPRRIRRVGLFRRLSLHPVTLARAAAMESLGCGLLNGRLSASESLLAAWILSVPEDDIPRIASGDVRGGAAFVRKMSKKVDIVEHAVNVFLGEAMLPFVPPKKQDSAIEIDDGLPHGYGWPLEIAEALCAHYGWTVGEAMRTEVSRAFALLAVSRSRTGMESGGPDYYDRIRLERWKACGIIPPRKEATGG